VSERKLNAEHKDRRTDMGA